MPSKAELKMVEESIFGKNRVQKSAVKKDAEQDADKIIQSAIRAGKAYDVFKAELSSYVDALKSAGIYGQADNVSVLFNSFDDDMSMYAGFDGETIASSYEFKESVIEMISEDE